VLDQVSHPGARRRSRLQNYPVTWVGPSPWQPRLRIDRDKLAPLADSIRRYGFISHLEARPDPDDPQGRLQLVFGHRRFEAALLVGLATIPVVVVDRTDDEMRTIALVENDTAEALTDWEQALCVGRLRRETGWTLAQIAAQLDRSPGWVQNRHDLTRIPEHTPLRAAIEAGQITMTDANTLATMPAAEQVRLLPRVIAGEINVQHLRDMKPGRRATVAAAAKSRRSASIGLASTPGRQDVQVPGVGAPLPTTAVAEGSPSPTTAPPPVDASPGPVRDLRHPGDDAGMHDIDAAARRRGNAARHESSLATHERVLGALSMLDGSDAGVILSNLEELLHGIDLTDSTPLRGDDRARLDAWADRFTRAARLLTAKPG
jgi:ParB/RepB/Spo0J family partition protein